MFLASSSSQCSLLRGSHLTVQTLARFRRAHWLREKRALPGPKSYRCLGVAIVNLQWSVWCIQPPLALKFFLLKPTTKEILKQRALSTWADSRPPCLPATHAEGQHDSNWETLVFQPRYPVIPHLSSPKKQNLRNRDKDRSKYTIPK